MVKFSYQWLQDYFSSPLPPPDKLAELLTMRAFHVEAVERVGGDNVFIVDILPNRASDAAGYDGMAREIGAILGKPLKKRKTPRPREAARGRIGDALSVAVDAPDYCPRYSARIVRGARVGASPQWLRKRLAVSGLRAINAAVDAANYIMLKTGQPVHVFDYDKLSDSGKKKHMRVRLAKNNEPFISLEGKRYVLDASMLVIADERDVVGLAGVKGAKKAEVTGRSTNLVLEAANFSGPLIRRTTRALKLASDASARFANALDPSMTSAALDELASLILQLGGGTAAKGMIDIRASSAAAAPKIIPLFPSHVNRVLGADIPVLTMSRILKRLSLLPEAPAARTSAEPYWIVRIPAYRSDLLQEEDLIEEIGRLYGYEHIKAAPYHGMMRPVDKDEQYAWSMRIRERLAGFGFAEILSYAFIGDARETALLDEHAGALLELENPARPDMRFLRPILSFGMLRALFENDARADTRLFEIGAVYCRSLLGNAARGVFEEPHLNIAISRKGHAPEEAFYELKGVLSALAESLGIGDAVWFDDVPNSPVELGAMTRTLMHPYRSAELKIGGVSIGHIGMLHPEAQRSWKIKKPTAFCELSLTRLIGVGSKELEYREISRYPAIVRDLALFVPASEKIISILDVIENTAGDLLMDSDLFDIYEGSEVPDGKKNIAFHLVFQSAERTLSDREINAIMERVINALEERPEWEVRK